VEDQAEPADDNHLLDALTGCCVAASMQGVRIG
jgi:hypothetical protein